MKPKIESVHTFSLPMSFEMSPEIERDLERIRSPQDLNEALLAVHIEEAQQEIAAKIGSRIETSILLAMFPFLK